MLKHPKTGSNQVQQKIAYPVHKIPTSSITSSQNLNFEHTQFTKSQKKRKKASLLNPKSTWAVLFTSNMSSLA